MTHFLCNDVQYKKGIANVSFFTSTETKEELVILEEQWQKTHRAISIAISKGTENQRQSFLTDWFMVSPN